MNKPEITINLRRFRVALKSKETDPLDRKSVV